MESKFSTSDRSGVMSVDSLPVSDISTERTTNDNLGHAFCSRCYPADGDVIVSLCGVLRDDQPIGPSDACECVVCETFTACPRCQIKFHKPWVVA